jgi:uncharacterized membrane protein YdfJ with MMPL/SSD domain
MINLALVFMMVVLFGAAIGYTVFLLVKLSERNDE